MIICQAQRVAAGAPIDGLTRQTSTEMAARFGGMRSWQDNDHPIVLFRMEPGLSQVAGVDIMSLNRDARSEYITRYISPDLKNLLEECGIDFDKDWEKITNEEGIQILRDVEGLFGAPQRPLDAGSPR